MSAVRITPVIRTTKSGFSWKLIAGALAAGGVAIGYSEYQKGYNNNNNNNNGNNKNSNGKIGSSLLAGSAIVNKTSIPKQGTFEEYQTIYNEIAEKMRNEDDADGGAGRYGLLCRLAWHSSGSWLKEDNSGGSFGGTMRFPKEAGDGANNGLEYGRAFLLSIKEKHQWISFGDLWTLGGVAAVQEAGGPKIKWRPGRVDKGEDGQPPLGRLPDAAQGSEHIRNVFGRLDFNDRDTVALIGAHCLGKCHTDRSGFDGPWGPSFNMFTNDFYVRLLQGWHVRKWDGPKQWEDDETNSFMMLPTDYALKEDAGFLKYVKEYAADQDLFFKDFAKAYAALLERGVDYPIYLKSFVFKTLDEQEE